MILYNMRERGPYEYDKFVLNILQLYNAVNLAEIHELTDTETNIQSLTNMSDIINSLYDNINNTSEKVFVKFYNCKEEF